MKSKFLIIFCFLLQHVNEPLKAENSYNPEYYFDLNIEPANGYISGALLVKKPSDSTFLLDVSLKVKSIKADDKIIHVVPRIDTTNQGFNYFKLPYLPQKIEIKYEGKLVPDNLPKNVRLVNRVDSNLVELSDYIAWYPRFLNLKGFSFTVKLKIPAEFIAVMNGTKASEESDKRYSYTSWKSDKTVHNLCLFSAPAVKKTVLNPSGENISIYYQRLPKTYVDSMLMLLSEANNLLIAIFGKNPANTVIDLIYSPRSGHAYARVPMLLVSEEYALEQRNNKYGFARDFRLNTHEISHYWSKANTNSPDDWINEGLAEYSALLISDSLIGKEFSELLLNEYYGIINNTPTQEPITETTGSSVEREVNRYYKPTIMLHELEVKYGRKAMFSFLFKLDSTFAQNENANTALFLDVIENFFGKAEKDNFSEKLHSKGWVNKTSEVSYTYTSKDSIFSGTWSGPLTQFGQTTEFILHVRFKDSKPEFTLDSPDQDAFGIPVSDGFIDGNKISFKLGIAGAEFAGTLHTDLMQIEAIWKQRGNESTIILKNL